MAWTYNRATRRYHDPATGRFLGQKDLARLRDTFTDRLAARAATLGEALGSGEIGVTQWEGAMREIINAAHVDLAALGKGGRAQMTPADWGRVGMAIRRQYEYLANFSGEALGMTGGQIATRAKMYVGAATASYEKAHAAAWNVDLPAHPGEDCEGLTNCRCAWELVAVEGGVEATWNATGDENTCSVCADHAASWSPLFIPTGTEAAAPAAVEVGA